MRAELRADRDRFACRCPRGLSCVPAVCRDYWQDHPGSFITTGLSTGMTIKPHLTCLIQWLYAIAIDLKTLGFSDLFGAPRMDSPKPSVPFCVLLCGRCFSTKPTKIDDDQALRTTNTHHNRQMLFVSQSCQSTECSQMGRGPSHTWYWSAGYLDAGKQHLSNLYNRCICLMMS